MRRGTACIVVTLSLVGACLPERPPPLEPVRIGTIGSTSGSLATFGEALQNAIELAVESVNAAGGVFDGRPVELVAVDSASDPSTAAAGAQELVEAGVVAIVGPETSGQSLQVLEVVREAGVPMVSCCATSTSLSAQNRASSGFFFRTAPSDALQGKALAFVAREGVERDGLAFPACSQAAFFSRGDSYGDGFKAVFEANYPGATVAGRTTRIVAAGSFPNDDPSAGDIDAAATSFADAIEQNAATDEHLCVVFITFGFEGARLMDRLERRLDSGTLAYHYLTGDGAQEGAFLAEAANAPSSVRARLLGTVPFHADNRAFDEFVVAFEARHGTPPGAYAAQAFDAMFITALAVTRARSTDGVDVRNALFDVSGRGGGQRFENGNFFGEIAASILAGDAVDYVGPSGELTFDAVGDVQGDYVLWQIEDSGGALGFVDRVPLPVSQFDPR
jgi:ABC-type branched-subunit amino acid transport system substrate-binding protein